MFLTLSQMTSEILNQQIMKNRLRNSVQIKLYPLYKWSRVLF